MARVIALPGDASAVQFIRRARGYAPLPLKVTAAPGTFGKERAASDKMPVVLAVGSQQKSTLCYLHGDEAFVSQHIGDREDAAVDDAWFDAKERFERLFGLSPTCYACDAHPTYVASQWARAAARESGLALVEVQHHHAHIASVLGEHGLLGPVCGIAFDGTGAGPDGAVWGGEVLIANRSDYERFANFSYVPMPGAAACVRHPLRMAYGVLWAFDLLEHPAAADALRELGAQASVCSQMIERTLNTPFTSSVGRLFDAAAALLGVCKEATYEGEPAVLFDSAQYGGSLGWCATGEAAHSAARVTEIDARDRYRVDIVKNAAGPASTAHDTSVVLLDAAPLFKALLDDKQAGVGVSVIARRFHEAIARAAFGAAVLVRSVYGIDSVALSGGVFMNKFLVEQTSALLAQGGFTVALNADLPPNDGCVSFGQSIVAASRL